MAIIYIRGPNPIWFFNNLTGAPLDDTYYAFFLTNDLPYVPQAVYQDPNGINAWPNPIEFQPSGGLPNNLYFNPDETYRIEIRQGPTQTYPLIWLVQNYTAGEGSGGGVVIADPLTVAANLIVDPNFSDVFFNGSYTYTNGTPGTYTLTIAPGWQIVLVGTGTTVLTQGLIAGVSDVVGNPPYYLGISNTGWTSATLVQTLPNNGAIFAGGAVAVALTAQAVSSSQPLTVNYVPNGPANSQSIFSGVIATGGFQAYYGALGTPGNLMNASLNTNTGTNGNVQIQFVLPPNGNVQLTNIQVVGQSNPTSANFVAPSGTNPGSVPLYQELTYPQIVNGEFNVYRDSILNHPKDTLLVGWNFATNPWQFTTTTVTAMAQGTSAYAADQTLILQQEYISTSGSTDSNIQVGQAADTYNYGLQVQYNKANNQFALLQYIHPNTIRPYWGMNLSAKVKALINTAHSTTVKFKMRLLYIAGLPSSTSGSYPISSWTAGSDPVFASGVTAIAPQNDPVYTLSSVTPNSFDFDKFVLPASTNANMTLGVLIYTESNMATGDFIVFNDVSLVQNDFAIATNPKTADEVLRECQYYFEKSYDPSVLPATANGTGYVFNNGTIFQGASNTFMYWNDLFIQFKQQKCKIPAIALYALDGTSSAVQASLRVGNAFPTPMSGTNPMNVNANGWTGSPIISTGYAFFNTISSTAIFELSSVQAGANAEFSYHYTADARLG